MVEVRAGYRKGREETHPPGAGTNIMATAASRKDSFFSLAILHFQGASDSKRGIDLVPVMGTILTVAGFDFN